jgi:hypothetical protein
VCCTPSAQILSHFPSWRVTDSRQILFVSVCVRSYVCMRVCVCVCAAFELQTWLIRNKSPKNKRLPVICKSQFALLLQVLSCGIQQIFQFSMLMLTVYYMFRNCRHWIVRML